MMFHLIYELSEVYNYKVFNNYLITSSKQNIQLYDERNFNLLGKLSFNRFPKILDLKKDSFLLQDQMRYLEIDYSLLVKDVLVLDFKDVWMTHYIDENCVLFKQAVDRVENHFQIVKYNLKEREIVWVSKCDNYKLSYIDTDHIITDNAHSNSLICFDTKSGDISWEADLNKIFSELYSFKEMGCLICSKPVFYKKTLIVHIQKIDSGSRYLACININTGVLNWHTEGYSNYELYNEKIYCIEFYGLYRVLNPESGEVEKEIDLKDEFERMDINCEHRFNVTDTHIYFKHAIKGKFGVLNQESFKVEEVQQLPDGNTISTEEFPIPFEDKLYVRSAPKNNLFIYKRE
ncbi:hypothetical protein [Aquimarina algiphila]|uniref:hypothetical protein n=1 Tax=Aquimarina algiphila TaxID=2047982 RepID=UPI00232D8C8B|nr:hypothetical protein [Aquimarina algiphila]